MFKNYLIIASKSDKAGHNIVTELFQYIDEFKSKNIDFHLIEGSILNERNLDNHKISKYDFIIFASKHKSEKAEKTLSIHAPGNFRQVWGGGEAGKLSVSSALFNKHLFEVLNENVAKHELKNYNVTLEVTHHGPLINKPCVFIEIGSTEAEWRDRRAGFVIARTIKDAIETFKPNKYREVAIGIGGPHYAPSFNKIQLNSNIALSHIIPSYMQPIEENMIKESIEKTFEEVDFAIIDWKGLGKSEQRDKVIEILEKNYIQWKKTSNIRK